MTQITTPGRPRPIVNQDNQFFWDGIARGEILAQRCDDCNTIRHPPSPMCPWCQSFNWHPARSSGRGRVYSFAVAHRPLPTGFVGPVHVVLVELEEGWRFLAEMGDLASTGDLYVGAPVLAKFVEVEPGYLLPQFQMDKSQEDRK